MQTNVLALQMLHPTRPIDVQPAVPLAPALVALLGDVGLHASNGDAVALGHSYLDLAQRQHQLLRRRPLSSLHLPLLRFGLVLSISRSEASQSGQDPARLWMRILHEGCAYPSTVTLMHPNSLPDTA